MKSPAWKWCLMAGSSFLMLCGSTTGVFAANQDLAGPDERLQRMEQRIKELAERQEQLMRRFGGPQERQSPMPQPGMMPQASSERALPGVGDMLRLVLLACIVCNTLLAIWIYTDIRKRGEGSGIFIALALVAGIPAAIIYSLVRIADKISVAGK
jgi:hypothetical protein